MRPVIGLIPLFDDDKDSYWMLPGYMKAMERCGALPIMLPLTTDHTELDDALSLCQGLLLTGGHDVGPYVYGEVPHPACGTPCRARDTMEGYFLDRALEQGLPILGICRGIQFMNAHLGGNLYQDLPSEYPCTVEHHMTPPYDRKAHDVEVLAGTQLAGIIGAGIHAVNSYHHQAVRTVAPGLKVMATSEDGLVEAIAVQGQPFAIGVQWHPEFSYETSTDSLQIMQAFVEAATAYKSC